MSIKSVTYQKVYAIGAYITERIGVEASVDEGQDPKFVLAELKKLCDEVNTANNPHLTETNAPEPTTLPTLKVEREQIEGKSGDSILEGINAADSWDGVKGLKSYQYLVKSNPAWLEAFNNQKIKLGIIG